MSEFDGGPGSQQPRPRRAIVEPDEGDSAFSPQQPEPDGAHHAQRSVDADDTSATEVLPSHQTPAPVPPPPPPPPPIPGDPARDRSRLPLVLGIVILLAVAAVIAYLALRDNDAKTAEPAPTSTATVSTPAETPTTTEAAPPTAEATTPAADPTQPETEAPTAEPTETVTEDPVDEAPAAEPEPLTDADLPETLAGHTRGEHLIYTADGHSVFLSDLGIPEMDPAWQEMTFPGAKPVADNAFCSTDDEGSQGCFIISTKHGVVTASGDPGVDITAFVVALAKHLA
ncbi:MAG: hypothetical protein Q4G70_05095 [Pseudomonadota bacterium]|nr:hypothetical protein [Pseudomonadota bacterium]